MKAKIYILLILLQITFSCKEEEYCAKEIRKLTEIKLPENIEVIECYDNLEYQFIFEYKLNNLSDADSLIKDNELLQYFPQKGDSLILDSSAIEYVGEFFNPNKFYPKENTTYYLQKKNYTIVFDKSKGKLMGVVEY